MTLRRRLAWAGIAVVVFTGIVFALVALVQRHYVLDQLDQRVESLVADTKTLLVVANRADDGGSAASSLLSEAYVGVLRADGRLRTVVAPADDPQLVPHLLGNERDAGLVTRGTVAGQAPRVRLEVAPLGAGRWVVVAVSMAPVEQATTRLALALGVAWLAIAVVALLVGSWVERFGLRPIAQLTQAATGVTASGGREPVQVPVSDPRTEVGQLGEAFNQMVATTTDGQEQLRRFVADAGHELRTPLTTLQGYSALYAAGGLPDDSAVADAMRRINAEATRMNRIVTDLLDLAALGDHSALVLSSVAVDRVLDDLAADLRVRQPQRPVSVEVGAGCLVVADEDRLRQALTALLENAVKYSAPGTGLRLIAGRRQASVRIAVADAGPGIAQHELPHIFDRFYRVASSGSRPAGSGLGLAIVAAIVTAHGGAYGVDSAPGIGSTFWIELGAAASA